MPPYFKGEPRFAYFERTAFRLDQWRELRRHAEARGLEFLSSPFSIEAVHLLEEVGIGRYKIPSGEVSNLPLLDAVAATGKPVLLSSGMSSWAELDAAVATIRRRHDRITVLQCTSAYPCPDERVGLNLLAEMRARWGLPVGYSDHTLDNHAAFAAAALGASAIEKHLTFSRRMYGSDAAHSAEPAQFAELVRGLRAISTMLAHPIDKDRLGDDLAAMKEIFEKSVVSVTDIAAGAIVTAADVAVKKPGTGIPAARLAEVIGSRAARPIPRDRLLTDADLVWKTSE
jgi:N-acetylneuraminate synthase